MRRSTSFFAGRYGMGTSRSENGPLVFTTHSTHKLLAAFSQASMIHVQDGGARQLDRDRFNEAFMMHISTSPQYGIIASLDVASAMMEGPAGRSLLQEMFDEALSFRRALANLRQHIAADDWWFSIWQPPSVEGIDRVVTQDWLLQPEDDWHGFGGVTDDYVLLDPIKVTLVMPGLTAGGALSERGIPAAVVSKFLWERGLVVEKTGLYSFPGAVLHGHHQGQVEHAAHRATGIQAQLRRQRQSGQLPAVRGAGECCALSGHGPA